MSYRDPSCSVFVGNLETSEHEAAVMEEILWELFLQAGPLKSVHLPKDKDTGTPKKFAFVEFEHDVSVPYACELLGGIHLCGRSLLVKPSTQGNDNTPNRSINSPSQSPSSYSPQGYSFDNTSNTFISQQRFEQRPGNPFMFGGSNAPKMFNSPHGITSPPHQHQGNWNPQMPFQTPPSWNAQGSWGNQSPVHQQVLINVMNSANRQGNYSENQPHSSRSSQSYRRQNRY